MQAVSASRHSLLARTLPLVFLALSFTARSQTEPLKIDHSTLSGVSFEQYRSYAWLPYIDSAASDPFNHEQIDGYISDYTDAVLSGRGLKIDNEQPDLQVQYLIYFRKKNEVVSEPVYGAPKIGVGFGTSFGRWNGANMNIHVSGPSVKGMKQRQITLREGALIFQLIDTNTGEVVWRGTASSMTEDNGELINKKQMIEEVLQKLFKKLPKKLGKN